jgi:hypothetical protein
VASFVFMTSMPVMPDQEAAPVVLGEGDQINEVSSNFTGMINDFQLALAGGPTDVLGMISYAPPPRRMINLFSSGPLQFQAWSIGWRNRLTNQIVAANLKPGGSVFTKLYYERVFG